MATQLPGPPGPHDAQPQRVCPSCSTVARTTSRECPHCRRSYRRRSSTGAIVTAVVLSALATVAATFALLAATADDVDREIGDEIDVVQRDIEREVARAQRQIEAEVERLRQDIGAGRTTVTTP